MPSDVKINRSEGTVTFTAYLHLNPSKGARHTKSNGGSYADERTCAVKITAPLSAWTTPTFVLDVDLTGGVDEDEKRKASIVSDITAALDDLPVTVEIVDPHHDEE